MVKGWRVGWQWRILSFAGTATLGTDYTLIASDADGIAYTQLDGNGGDPTVTFTGPATSTATIDLRARLDIDTEGTESVQVSVEPSAAVFVDGGIDVTDELDDFNIDDPAEPPVTVTLRGGSAVTEGGDAVFTVTASRAPTAVLTVADDRNSDFIAAVDEGAGSVTVAIGETTATCTLATVDDGMDEANGTLSVTLQAGNYIVGDPSMANVAVNDNDDGAAARGTVSPMAVTVSEDGGTTDSYTVVLDAEPSAGVQVRVTSQDPGIARVNSDTLSFATDNWNAPQTVVVSGVNDDADNPGDERRTTIAHAIVTAVDGYRTDLVIRSVAVRVTDDDEASAVDEALAQMQTAQEAWLPQFGLTAVDHMLNGLDYRFTAAPLPGLTGQLNGLPGGGAGAGLKGRAPAGVRVRRIAHGHCRGAYRWRTCSKAAG